MLYTNVGKHTRSGETTDYFEVLLIDGISVNDDFLSSIYYGAFVPPISKNGKVIFSNELFIFCAVLPFDIF